MKTSFHIGPEGELLPRWKRVHWFDKLGLAEKALCNGEIAELGAEDSHEVRAELSLLASATSISNVFAAQIIPPIGCPLRTVPSRQEVDLHCRFLSTRVTRSDSSISFSTLLIP